MYVKHPLIKPLQRNLYELNICIALVLSDYINGKLHLMEKQQNNRFTDTWIENIGFRQFMISFSVIYLI